MSRSSVLQPLGGPLAGRALEFPGHDVVLGSAPDCEVRIDVAGVHPYHARIVISETGATLFGIEGIVGINDDKVLGEGRLNNGDFVWIGEPGADGSLMFQFTLGSTAAEEPEVLGDLMEEIEPQDLALPSDDMDGFEVQESIDDVEIGEPTPDLDLLDIEPEPQAEPFFAAPLPEPYPEPEPAPVLPAPKTLSSSGAFKPPAPWQSAALPEEPPAPAEYASAWESKPAAPEPVEEVHEEFEAPEPEPEPPPPAPRAAVPPPTPPKRQNTSPNPRPKLKAVPEVDLAALVPPHPQRPERTTSSTGVIVGGLITLILVGIGVSWVVNSTPPVDAPPSVPGSVVMPTRKPVAPATAAGLLQDSAAAAAAGDVARAGQLLNQAAQLEPGNAEVAARKAEIDARLVFLGRMFSPGATTVTGVKGAGGPAATTDLAAQIRCGVTPASVEPGQAYTVRCSIVNTGAKPFRLESVNATETADGVRLAFAGTAPPQDLAPQGEAMVLEKAGTWSARTQWSLDLTAKTTKAESFVVNHSWR